MCLLAIIGAVVRVAVILNQVAPRFAVAVFPGAQTGPFRPNSVPGTASANPARGYAAAHLLTVPTDIVSLQRSCKASRGDSIEAAVQDTN
jgi:hypothetical protein